MKIKNKTLGLISALLLSLFFIKNTDAQILKKLKNRVSNRAENNILNKAGNATDKAIDKVFGGLKKDKNSKEKEADALGAKQEEKTTMAAYKNYDFVPGDKIIFAPDLSKEADAEMPARFTIKAGTAEIETYNGEKILHLQPNAKTAIEPLMSTNHYLPEQFTLEFDMMYENPDSYFKYISDFRVGFLKRAGNNYYNGGVYSFIIDNVSKCSFGNATKQSFPEALVKSFGNGNTWHHIAIYVRKNIGKAYVDQYRVCGTNTLPTGADKFYIKADRYGIKIKNLRLAAGGDDKYDKIVTDGKIISHGILFDVNKSSIRPQSMGALNEIAKLMKEHPDLKFEIDGHTDSDGAEAANLKLSQERAAAVKNKLVKMGIAADRFTTKGLGESKPIDKNDTAEGKANNRRVEFIRK